MRLYAIMHNVVSCVMVRVKVDVHCKNWGVKFNTTGVKSNTGPESISDHTNWCYINTSLGVRNTLIKLFGVILTPHSGVNLTLFIVLISNLIPVGVDFTGVIRIECYSSGEIT